MTLIASLKFTGRHVLTLLCLLFAMKSVAQTNYYPPDYHRQTTDEARVVFLRQFIKDSAAASHYTYVPLWCHTVLRLVHLPQNKDTVSMLMYQFLGDSYDGKQPDSAAYYYQLSLRNWKGIRTPKKIYLQQSLLYVFVALDNKDSILYYTHALEQTIKDLPDTSNNKLSAMNTIAGGYSEVNQYQQAISAYRSVIRNALKAKDSATLRNAFVNTGNAYDEISDDRMAIYYTLQALPYLGNDPGVQMTIYANLCGYYQAVNSIDSSRIFLLKAETVAAKLDDENVTHNIKLRRASLLIAEGNYNAAMPLLQSSLDYLKKQTPDVNLVNCLIIYSTLDTGVNNYPRAEQHLRMLYDITREMNHKAYRLENLRFLTYVNERLGDYKDAYQFQKMYVEVSDSIRSDKAQQSLAELQTEYQTYKKVEEINLLKKEAVIKNLELSAASRNKALLIGSIIILIAAFATILYNRNLRNKTELKNLKVGLEMKSLRSQMNPHFIFNSLNSIQKYIWENKQEDAAEYLTKFARLIRLVLENSQYEMIALSEDITALKLYIEMEQRRNNQRFDYTIEIAPDIDVEKTLIPPLLLQPYVENAVWHGLSQKEERGMLRIDIKRTNDSLICTVDDNGIGRKRAAELKPIENQKTSLGMNISSQRIEWLQKETGARVSVEIIDKQEGSLSKGTAVIITLPLKETV